jgi:glutaredoxin
MNMNKQTLVTTLLLLIIIGLLSIVVVGSRGKSKNETTESKTSEKVVVDDKTPVFFYGNTCPHCADVETWMKENKIEEKIRVVKKEVYANKQNAQELTEAAQNCNLPTDSIGVPFLYVEGKCLIGSPDVISYLSQKAGIK